MNTDASSPPICSNCQQRPAVGMIVSQDEVGGPPQRMALCEVCLGDSPLAHMGSILQRMLGGGLGGPNAPEMTTGPVSHPEPSEQMRFINADAMFLAAETGSRFCDTQHLLGAVLRSEAGRNELTEAGLSSRPEALAQAFSQNVFNLDLGPAPAAPVMVLFSPSAAGALRLATKLAARERSRTFDVRHLITALLANHTDVAARILHDAGVRPRQPVERGDGAQSTADRQTSRDLATPALDQFGRDITRDAADGKIDPVIGRRKEIERVVRILARRRKNNPVLIGEPGVGKTAIAEGLALRIVNNDVPETIKDRRVISLDVASMVAGSMMRGAFEQRLKAVLKEVIDSEGSIILFIDELHNIVGAGSAEGSMDAANMLKPALARGEMQTIGATTLEEYRRIEKDGALARRFQPVLVEEPDVEETIDILRGIKDEYETHHRAHFSDAALCAAAKLSDRYVTEYFQPDKAIDLMDEAGALVRMNSLSATPEVDDLRQEMEAARAEKDRAVASEDFEQAAILKQRLDELTERLTELEATNRQPGEVANITDRDVAAVVADKTGVPAGDLLEDEMEKLRHLEADLHERVIGQDVAVGAVADSVRRARAGLADRNEPTGTFIFLGPTGVGKTELAKALAERLFGTEDALVRIDGSEYRESHTAARLVSAPPGYVGYGKGGQLTEPVRRRPYSVVLIDEVEKMHPDVWNYFLQVMDDGRLTDGEGRTADFRNAIIIMTSNVGARRASRPLGFVTRDVEGVANAEASRIRSEAKKLFPPEFINRLDDSIVFNQLTAHESEVITGKLGADIGERLAEREITLTIEEELVRVLAADGFDEEYGGRPLRRHLRKTLDKVLTDAIIDGSLPAGASVHARLGVRADETALTPVELDITPTGEDETQSEES